METAVTDLTRYTGATPTTASALERHAQNARRSGFAVASGTLESGIHGLCAPVYDHSGHFAGTVSVAGVAARMTPELTERIKGALMHASRQISHNWGGRVPQDIETLWAAQDLQTTVSDPIS